MKKTYRLIFKVDIYYDRSAGFLQAITYITIGFSQAGLSLCRRWPSVSPFVQSLELVLLIE